MMAIRGYLLCAVCSAGSLLLIGAGGWLRPALAQGPNARLERPALEWHEVAAGVSVSEYRVGGDESVFAPRILLVRVRPRLVRFQVVQVLGGGSDLKMMTESVGGTAGINANFFDENHLPLGLVIAGGRQLHPLQRGGSTLTGVFSVKNDVPSIVHRDSFDTKDVELAVQAGPRLVAGGRALPLRSDQDSSRRSGVAITDDGAVLFFATVLRFPGASFDEVISMLLDPVLHVRDAMNFDGGGSSQLFIEDGAGKRGEIFVHGGDTVPVGLIVKRR